MKKFIVALMTIFLVGLCACGSNTNNQEAAVASTPDHWDGIWVFAIDGKPSDAFGEFTAVVYDGDIQVKQGDTVLWQGTFDTSMPTDGKFTVTSVRDATADLYVAHVHDKHLDFPYDNGVLTYTEDGDTLEFVKGQ